MKTATHRVSLHQRGGSKVTIYQVTDRLHTEHTVLVPGHAIAATAGWLVYVGFAGIGLYLTYVGWLVAEDQSTPQAASSAPDLPRAA